MKKFLVKFLVTTQTRSGGKLSNRQRTVTARTADEAEAKVRHAQRGKALWCINSTTEVLPGL